MHLRATKDFFDELRKEVGNMPNTVSDIKPASQPIVAAPSPKTPDSTQIEKPKIITDNTSQTSQKNGLPVFTLQQIVDYAKSRPESEASIIEAMLGKLCRNCDKSVYNLIDSILESIREKNSGTFVKVDNKGIANIGCDQQNSNFTLQPSNNVLPTKN